MVTPDKDYAQLVRPQVLMCRPGSKGSKTLEILGVEQVCQKYNLTSPQQVIDLLALMGDSSDNIPGCPGVGEKTAAKLLAQFGSVDQLLARSQEVKGKLGEKISTHAEQIRLSKWLATIKTDVPCAVQLQELRLGERQTESLRTIFGELGFHSFIARYLDKNTPQLAPPTRGQDEADLFSLAASSNAPHLDIPTMAEQEPLSSLAEQAHDYRLVVTLQEAQALCQQLLEHRLVAIDTETTSTDALTANLVGMSFAVENSQAWYVAVPSDPVAAQTMVAAFRPLFEHTSIEKVGQNLKYDLNVLHRYGVNLREPMFDTMLAHYVLQPEGHHNMEHLAQSYLHYTCIPIEQLIGSGRQQKNMGDLPAEDIVDYACEDADVTWRLHAPLLKALQTESLESVFRNIEMPLMPVLARMERNGVRFDQAANTENLVQLQERLLVLETEIYALAGEEFLLTSPKQVGEILFGKLKISAKVRKTKTGQYSTSEEVLENLRNKHEIVAKILQHRGLKKLLSTYVEALPKLIHPSTGCIHSSFNQAVTATGRLSSSNPNLQNIPVRGAEGREIRRAFIPEEGCRFLSADYSQIELRIMAHLSEDEAMISDFQAGKDIHAATAARIFGKALEAVNKDERRQAKTANFGIIYGISAFGLSERMGVSRSDAKALIESYFATYPKVKAYMEKSIERAKTQGYITTQFGRRRYLNDINSANATVRGFAERNAINAPIQGTAADLIKLAMIAIDARLQKEQLRTKMILQVHDELNFSVPQDELEQVRQLVVEEMEAVYAMRVPLIAECGEGDNWLEAH